MFLSVTPESIVSWKKRKHINVFMENTSANIGSDEIQPQDNTDSETLPLILIMMQLTGQIM